MHMGVSFLLLEGYLWLWASMFRSLSVCCWHRSGPRLPPGDFFWSSISSAMHLPKSAHLVSAPAFWNRWQAILLRFIRPFRAASSKLPFFFAIRPQRNPSKKWRSDWTIRVTAPSRRSNITGVFQLRVVYTEHCEVVATTKWPNFIETWMILSLKMIII